MDLDPGRSEFADSELHIHSPQSFQVGVNIAAHIWMVLPCGERSGAAPLPGRTAVQRAAPGTHAEPCAAGTMSSMLTSTTVPTNGPTAA